MDKINFSQKWWETAIDKIAKESSLREEWILSTQRPSNESTSSQQLYSPPAAALHNSLPPSLSPIFPYFPDLWLSAHRNQCNQIMPLHTFIQSQNNQIIREVSFSLSVLSMRLGYSETEQNE
ncbi:hypothetical protein WR25_03380 [Diploscapter pachys]|uniref:Uncharacterized protein n=1 Tax=Diploscapter pachys TaxID=2018661 RepID=A0A2A2LLG3_9BILA|nr:hypothetical protein WR25_03380 [Diploscapter pachys]